MRTVPLPAAAFLVLAAGCSDYGFGSDPEVGDPLDSGTGEEGGDSGTPDETGDTGDSMPDPILEGDCPEGTVATFDQDEIYVKSWERTEATGVLTTAYDGWYHVYDYSLAESGDEQTNESIYLRITNGARTYGKPLYANCEGEDWVVADSDNDGFPSDSRIYVGTFWLQAGDNDLTLHHYCPRYREGACPEHHVETDADSTCDSDGPNSAHFYGEGICLVSAEGE